MIVVFCFCFKNLQHCALICNIVCAFCRLSAQHSQKTKPYDCLLKNFQARGKGVFVLRSNRNTRITLEVYLSKHDASLSQFLCFCCNSASTLLRAMAHSNAPSSRFIVLSYNIAFICRLTLKRSMYNAIVVQLNLSVLRCSIENV